MKPAPAILSLVLVAITPTQPASPQPGPPERRVTVLAEGRGDPWLHLADGRELPAEHRGPEALRAAMREPSSRPMALATADFDEDGVPDIVASYSSSGTGILALHRGNIDAIYPNEPEAKKRMAEGRFVDAPFLPAVDLFETPGVPDFLGAGDFDGDSHQDVVAAGRGGAALLLHPGDGNGGFGPPEEITLPGSPTLLVTGEINRRDGLEDLIVAVDAPSGPQVLVFEGPRGALRASPERFDLPEQATDFALGDFDGRFGRDLAVAAGSTLVIVHGRDRELSLPPALRRHSAPAEVQQIPLAFNLVALELGDFGGRDEPELALLDDEGLLRTVSLTKLDGLGEPGSDEALATPIAPSMTRPTSGAAPGDESQAKCELPMGPALMLRANVSHVPGDDLLIIDPCDQALRLRFPGDAPPGSAAADAESPAGRWTTLDVMGRPRALLPMRLNVDAVNDLVLLSEGPGPLATIETYAASIHTVTNTNDLGSGSLAQALLDSSDGDTIAFDIPGPGVHTIRLTLALASVLDLTIDGTTQPGYAGEPLIEIDASLLVPLNDWGLQLCCTTTVRGLIINGGTRLGSPALLLQNNRDKFIEGNYIGVSSDGSTVAWAGFGISARATGSGTGSGVTIGGSAPPARNIIAGGQIGLLLSYCCPAGQVNNVTVEGNYIGTNRNGTAALGEIGIGINNWVTDVNLGPNNVINHHDTGIRVNGNVHAEGILIRQNKIGTDPTGTFSLSSSGFHGVHLLDQSPYNDIGGTLPSEGNLISGNGDLGVLIQDPASSGNVVLSNYIGTDATGTSAIPNGSSGVYILQASSNNVGGAVSFGNLISGNGADGVVLDSHQTSNTFVVGNLIGTDVMGSSPLGNGGRGVVLLDSFNNTIGASPAGNVISSNGAEGVLISGMVATGNDVAGNRIGTDSTGAAPLGNGAAGVAVRDASTNLIGGLALAAGNVIGGNLTGVEITGATATDNRVLFNLIGTDLTGGQAVSNGTGVLVSDGANLNMIGEPLKGNVISGNLAGILITGTGTTGNTVQGNHVGTDLAGMSALGNAGNGVRMEGDAQGNLIGGPSDGEGNLISGNLGNGVDIGQATLNVVQGNLVGTDISGLAPLPNAIGIRSVSGSGNEIGGAGGVGGNTVAFNTSTGVSVEAGGQASIRSNSIHSNGSLGIDLEPGGVNPNDPGDADTGANALQNFPEIDAADATGGSVSISWKLASTPLTSFDLDFFTSNACDPSGHGEGEVFLGSAVALTDASGVATGTDIVSGGVFAGSFITATATDAAGNTSEFSPCFTASGVPPMTMSSVGWTPGSTASLEWPIEAGAISYNIYEGGSANLPNLLNQNADSCQRASVQTNVTGEILTQQLPPGEFLWYLVTPVGIYGEGGVGPAASGPRDFQSTGFCGSSCANDVCDAGAPNTPLESACDTCTASVCAADPYCCTTDWDSVCVEEVRTVCGSLRCSESQGQCSHTLCSAGTALAQGCDSPPAGTSCVDQICAVDPACCDQGWDAACVEEVTTVCGMNCN